MKRHRERDRAEKLLIELKLYREVLGLSDAPPISFPYLDFIEDPSAEIFASIGGASALPSQKDQTISWLNEQIKKTERLLSSIQNKINGFDFVRNLRYMLRSIQHFLFKTLDDTDSAAFAFQSTL